jgi:hypothetical protein
MSWHVVPPNEMPKVLEALRDSRCVSCYGPVVEGHALYCCTCDDVCDHPPVGTHPELSGERPA